MIGAVTAEKEGNRWRWEDQGAQSGRPERFLEANSGYQGAWEEAAEVAEVEARRCQEGCSLIDLISRCILCLGLE